MVLGKKDTKCSTLINVLVKLMNNLQEIDRRKTRKLLGKKVSSALIGDNQSGFRLSLSSNQCQKTKQKQTHSSKPQERQQGILTQSQSNSKIKTRQIFLNNKVIKEYGIHASIFFKKNPMDKEVLKHYTERHLGCFQSFYYQNATNIIFQTHK